MKKTDKKEKTEKTKLKNKIFKIIKKDHDIKEDKMKKKTSNIVKVKEKEENPDIKEKGVSFSLLEVIVIIIITGLIVSVCSGLIVYNNYDKLSYIDDSESQSELEDFIESYNHIINSYVNEVDREKLIEAGIQGMYTYLNDVYSIYIDEDTTETLTEQLEGSYEGIGVEIGMNEDNQIYITKIFSDTPAEKSGLKVNDIITKLDDESLEGKTSAYLAYAIKDSDNSTFKITYLRDKKESTVTVTRELVYIDSVTSKEYDSVGYVSIETFSATTAEQVKEKLAAFSDSIDSIIIDVRDNSGGYLSAAYDTANLFIDKGKCIYQLKDKNGNITKKNASTNAYKNYEKIVVLINGQSASASEILAAALKESANATTVGETSFGKGTVQETEKLKSGAMVKYTTAYWLTPDGNSINEKGITPDIEIKNNTTTEADEQLNKALETAK